MTGESESGRSTKAFRKPLPRMLLRTITSAQTIPNTVLTTTAIPATRSVSLNAETVSGSVIAAQAPSQVLGGAPHHHRDRPDENERQVAERDEAEREPTHGRAL